MTPAAPPTILLAAIVVAQGAIVSGIAIAHLATVPGLTLDVIPTRVADPDAFGVVTHVDVVVTNRGDDLVSPVFFIPANHLQNWFQWSVSRGPYTLAPGESAAYTVFQPPETALRPSIGFRVVVSDRASGDIRGQSEVVHLALAGHPVAILNPEFLAWGPSMIAPYDLPFGWIPHDPDNSDATVGPLRDGHGVRITLAANPDRKAPELFALTQRIEFPEMLNVEFDGRNPAPGDGVAGVLIDDVHRDKRIIILHSSARADDEDFVEWVAAMGPAKDTRIIRTSGHLELDLVDQYGAFGWHIPAKARVAQFLTPGPENFGVGGGASAVAMAKFEVMRAVDLGVFALAHGTNTAQPVTVAVGHVGGPALDMREGWSGE